MQQPLLLPFFSAAENHLKPALLLLLLLLGAATAQAQTTYFWRGAANANFAGTPDNWCTSPVDPVTTGNRRNSAATTDILVFSGGSPVVTVNTGQTVGRLKFTNSTSVTLNSSSNTTNNVNINGDAADDDLIVETGSAVALVATGTSGSMAGVTLNLRAGATGKVAGTITLTNVATSPPTSTDKLSSATDNALRFTAGGQLTILGSILSTAFSGNPVFEAGATLEQNAPNSSDISAANTADYRSGSTFRYIDGVFGSQDLSADRTFGNLEFASAAGRTIGGALNLTIFNNLTVTGGGTLAISARGNAANAVGTLIGGNISVTNPAATLNFNPSTAAPNVPRVRLNGTMPQTISSVGTLTFGANAKLEISNPAGVTLQSDLTINNELILTNGLLTTSSSGSGLLAMTAATPSVVGGSSTSFINGPLARVTTGAVNNLVFPVGKAGTNGAQNYRPITLSTTSQTNAVTYVGEQLETPPTQNVTSPLTRVSFRRYFSVTPSVAPAGTGFSANITLSFGEDDFVNFPADPTFVIAKRNQPTAWANIGRATTNATTGAANGGRPVSGTLTSGPFSSFSDFALASTSTTAPFPGINPLPVELTRFGARAQPGSVALDWATASEKNSERFEVERSADGTSFQAVGTVKAQGTSTSAHAYTFLDVRPLAGQAYYRLRQVDADGTAAYSPIAAVSRNAAIAIYPNPTSDFVTLPAGLGAVRYRVLNGLGQTVASGLAAGGDRLDLSALPKGAFFLELSDTAGRRTQRLMRQ